MEVENVKLAPQPTDPSAQAYVNSLSWPDDEKQDVGWTVSQAKSAVSNAYMAAGETSKIKDIETTELIESAFTTQKVGDGILAKPIMFDSQSKLSINAPGAEYAFYEKTVEIVFGIGNDHIGRLLMTEAAWGALNEGSPVNIETKDK